MGRGLDEAFEVGPRKVCIMEESRDLVIFGCDELRVEICLKYSLDEYAQCDFVESDSVVSYREVVSQISSVTCLVKSPKKNSHFVDLTTEPHVNELPNDIKAGRIGPQ